MIKSGFSHFMFLCFYVKAAIMSFTVPSGLYMQENYLGWNRQSVCLETLKMFIMYSKLWAYPTFSYSRGALECNLTGRCPFFKNLHNRFRKKICISIPCFGIFRLQNNRENNSLLFLKNSKTITYCF